MLRTLRARVNIKLRLGVVLGTTVNCPSFFATTTAKGMQMEFAQILQDSGITFEAKEDKLRVCCPFHGDKNPSGVIFVESGRFHCRTCDKNWTFYAFVAKHTHNTPAQVYHDIQQQYDSGAYEDFSPTDVERFHGAIENPKFEKLKEELYKRAITDKTIRKYKLGVESPKSLAIPIRKPNGRFLGYRRYYPWNKDKKFGWMKGKSSVKGSDKIVYPIDQLEFEKVLLTEGELKALAAAQELNEHEIGAVTGLCGASTVEGFKDKLNGYTVYVCMDVDETGVKAAKKVCISLQDIARKIYLIELPLDKKKHPHGDINDYLAEGGKLLPLLEKAKEWEFQQPKKFDQKEEAVELPLGDAINAENATKRVKFKAVVSAVESSPFGIPKVVEVKCDRESKYCTLCKIPERCKPSEQIFEIEPESNALLRMAGVSEKEQHRVFQEEFDIPKLCQKVSFEPKTFYNVEHVCLSPELDVTSRDTSDIMQASYTVGPSVELNEIYEFEGRSFPHPKTQQITFLLSKHEETQHQLDTYKAENLEQYRRFRPSKWTPESCQDKLDEIYSDLEANVTRIFKRRNLHLTTDLCYHSPLLLTFDRRSNVNGWLQCLVIGDSSVGKSETCVNMMKHYGLGEKVDCDGTSVAGLVGGLQKFNDSWFLTWGKIPNNDRKFVLLEELKGASTDVISKLKDMRSSGEASLTKIKTRTTMARTRLLAISNPRSIIPVSGYNFGVDTVKELIGSLEDVRRFDSVLILGQDEVDVKVLQKHRPHVAHDYTGELCRGLILYCWTCPKVVFEDESLIFEHTNRLCGAFTDEIPILDRGSTRLKLAKLSAALAGRTFSTVGESEDGMRKILVRKCHVEYISDFLMREYSKPCFGYKDYSDMVFESESLVNEKQVKFHIMTQTKYPTDFIAHILNQELIDVYFIQDVCGWDQSTARETLSFLIRQRALKKTGRFYRKTSSFVALLKGMKENPTIDGPGYDTSNGEKY